MNWVSVISSVLAAVAYDGAKQHLYLRFHSGKIYCYFEFPQSRYDEFLAAESQGKYFGAYIRGRFRDEEVREVPLHHKPTYFSGI
jgi:hypothetical protein